MLAKKRVYVSFQNLPIDTICVYSIDTNCIYDSAEYCFRNLNRVMPCSKYTITKRLNKGKTIKKYFLDKFESIEDFKVARFYECKVTHEG